MLDHKKIMQGNVRQLGVVAPIVVIHHIPFKPKKKTTSTRAA